MDTHEHRERVRHTDRGGHRCTWLLLTKENRQDREGREEWTWRVCVSLKRSVLYARLVWNSLVRGSFLRRSDTAAFLGPRLRLSTFHTSFRKPPCRRSVCVDSAEDAILLLSIKRKHLHNNVLGFVQTKRRSVVRLHMPDLYPPGTQVGTQAWQSYRCLRYSCYSMANPWGQRNDAGSAVRLEFSAQDGPHHEVITSYVQPPDSAC